MKALKLNRKIFSNIVIVFVVIALPLFIWALVNLNFNYKKKAGGVVSPPIVNNSINWSNQWVNLTALNFYIDIEGKRLFTGNPQTVVRSDYGNPNESLTLEVSWPENDVEMRLYIYFRKNVDNTWTAYDISSYNGEYYGDWLSYGPLPPVQIGQAFSQENVDWYSTDGKGHIYFENLNLLPFKNLTPSPSPSPSINPIDWQTSDIHISADDFYVTSNNKKYTGQSSYVTLLQMNISNSHKGLEITSNQQGDTLKMFIDFRIDGSVWYVYEVRIYDSNISNSWVSYPGPFIYTGLGHSNQKSGSYYFTLRDPNTGSSTQSVSFTNLRIQAFTNSTPPPSPTPKVGDVNGDGHVNLIDIGVLIDLYDSTNPTNPRADINGDGIVNVIDIGFVIDGYEW